MTSDEFQKMALKIPAAVERSHMNHPDFRIAGKIFASLGVPDENWGMVKLGALARGSHRQPLQRRLKKCILERGLKCAAVSFTDAKLRSDFELRRTMDFHVHPAALCQ